MATLRQAASLDFSHAWRVGVKRREAPDFFGVDPPGVDEAALPSRKHWSSTALCLDLELTLEELFTGCVKHVTVRLTDGSGSGSRLATLRIPISPGLRAGTAFSLRAAAAGPSAAAATLTVVVREALHQVYRRVGDDLLAIVLVPLVVALTGGRVSLKRLDGQLLEITLPEDPVVRPGQVFSFKGEGMPCASDPSRRGNLHVRLQIQFPSSLASLTDDQRASLRQALSPRD